MSNTFWALNNKPTSKGKYRAYLRTHRAAGVLFTSTDPVPLTCASDTGFVHSSIYVFTLWSMLNLA